MSKVKVAVLNTVGRVVTIDTSATIGAQIETDLRMPDGSLANAAKLRAYIGVSAAGDEGIRDHRLLRGLRLGDDHPQYTQWVHAETITGQWQYSLPIWGANGTATLPEFTFTSDTSTGAYLAASESAALAIARTDSFKYNVVDGATATSDPQFATPEFDDSAWSTGIGPFGGPVTPAGTSVTPVTNRAIWIRKHVTLTGPATGADLTITVGHDDGGWLWINGVPISFTGWDVAGFHTFTIPASMLRIGDNVFVVRAIDSVPSGSPTNINCSLDVSASGPSSTYAISTAGEFRWGVGEGAVYQVVPLRIEHEDGLSVYDGPVRVFQVDDAEIYSTVPIHGPVGSASAPAFSFSADPNTGLYWSGADDIAIATAGVGRLGISTTQFTGTLPWRGQNGSAAAPAFSFSGDPDTGMCRLTADTVTFTTGGTARLDITTAQFTASIPWRGQNGNAGAPAYSFSGDANTGIYLSGADDIAISTAGVGRLAVTTVHVLTTLPVVAANGSQGTPSFSFSGDPDNGMYLRAANSLGFSTNGLLSFGIGAAGELLDGAASAGSIGQVIQSNGPGAAWTWGAAGASSPLTTKGDIYTFDTANARLPVGADGEILVADSSEPTGLAWVAAGGGGAAPATATYITEADETASLPNSLQLVAGSNVTFDTSTPNVLEINASGGGGGGAMSFVGSTTVAGAAATTITVGSLDLNTDEEYHVRIEVDNATGSAADLSLFFNADTTATNYDTQGVSFTGGTTSAARLNSARIGSLLANAVTSLEISIRRSVDGTVAVRSIANYGNTTAIILQQWAMRWRTSGTNVTGITLSSTVASSLAIGSAVRVWKITV